MLQQSFECGAKDTLLFTEFESAPADCLPFIHFTGFFFPSNLPTTLYGGLCYGFSMLLPKTSAVSKAPSRFRNGRSKIQRGEWREMIFIFQRSSKREDDTLAKVSVAGKEHGDPV